VGGTDTIVASFVDSQGNTQTSNSTTVEWTSVSGPTVDAGGPYAGHVGDAIAIAGSSSGTTSTTYSFPTGTPCTIADPSALNTSVTCTAPGDYVLTLSGTDGTDTVTDTANVHVTNSSTGGAKCFGQTPTIVGTAGDDVITGTPGNDVILAGKGNDTITSVGGDDVVCGNQGDDVIKSRIGGDLFVNGGSGSDTVIGGRGDDTVIGGQGDDLVRGNLGDDRVFGRIGDDHLIGGAGDDSLFGNAGDDVLVGGSGTNVLNGGRDTDRCGLASDGPETTKACESTV